LAAPLPKLNDPKLNWYVSTGRTFVPKPPPVSKKMSSNLLNVQINRSKKIEPNT